MRFWSIKVKKTTKSKNAMLEQCQTASASLLTPSHDDYELDLKNYTRRPRDFLCLESNGVTYKFPRWSSSGINKWRPRVSITRRRQLGSQGTLVRQLDGVTTWADGVSPPILYIFLPNFIFYVELCGELLGNNPSTRVTDLLRVFHPCIFYVQLKISLHLIHTICLCVVWFILVLVFTLIC